MIDKVTSLLERTKETIRSDTARENDNLKQLKSMMTEKLTPDTNENDKQMSGRNKESELYSLEIEETYKSYIKECNSKLAQKYLINIMACPLKII